MNLLTQVMRVNTWMPLIDGINCMWVSYMASSSARNKTYPVTNVELGGIWASRDCPASSPAKLGTF